MYQEQVNFRTSRSTFVTHSSRNLRVQCQAITYQQCQIASMWTEVE